MTKLGFYTVAAWLCLVASDPLVEAGSNPKFQHEIRQRLQQLRNKVHLQQNAIANLEIANAKQEETLMALRNKVHPADSPYQIRAEQETDHVLSPRDEYVDKEHVHTARDTMTSDRTEMARALQTESTDDQVPFPRTPAYRFQHQKIAFFAIQYVDQTVSRHGLVHFDHELVNFRQSYDVMKGVFVSPLRGIYIFSTSVSSSANSTCQVEIVYGHSVQLGVASADSLGSRAVMDQGAVTVVVMLNEGDRVWVRGLLPTNYIGGNRDTMFSGALIWELP